MTDRLIASVNNKHDLDRAIAAYTRQAGTAAAKRQAVEADTLVELMQGYYRHERWTRGLGHEVASRETLLMLDRFRASMCEAASDVLQQDVIDRFITYEVYQAQRMQVGRVAYAVREQVAGYLTAEGMGTDPLYLASPE